MPAATEARRDSVSATTKADWMHIAGTGIIQTSILIRSARRSRMHGDYTTCTAMYGNGARTGTAIMQAVLQPTRKGRQAEPPAFCAAAVGASVLAAVVQPIASGSIPGPGPPATVFGCVVLPADSLHWILGRRNFRLRIFRLRIEDFGLRIYKNQKSKIGNTKLMRLLRASNF